MLLGHPDVKADVMIKRYLQGILELGQPSSSTEARELVRLAAEGQDKAEVTATDLDYAIGCDEREK